jgi:hypothetical protein
MSPRPSRTRKLVLHRETVRVLTGRTPARGFTDTDLMCCTGDNCSVPCLHETCEQYACRR